MYYIEMVENTDGHRECPRVSAVYGYLETAYNVLDAMMVSSTHVVLRVVRYNEGDYLPPLQEVW